MPCKIPQKDIPAYLNAPTSYIPRDLIPKKEMKPYLVLPLVLSIKYDQVDTNLLLRPQRLGYCHHGYTCIGSAL